MGMSEFYGASDDAASVALLRHALDSGVNFFGSCWGLQMAVMAAGGTVERNARGREVAYARNLWLTDAGRSHSMHAGRAPAPH